MQLLGFMVFAGIIYCAFGAAINFILFKKAGNKDSEFQLDWKDVITWPKHIFSN